MILVIAEKPMAGIDIAKALGATEKNNGYMKGKDIIVTWANGHLVGLKEPQEIDPYYSSWNLDNLPIIFPEDSKLKVIRKKEFHIISKLIHDPKVDEIVNAGDPGREGEVIQRWIYKMAGNTKKVTRMWYNSLLPEAICKSFQNRSDSSLYDNLYEAGVARAEIDLLLGVNYSRMLTITKARGVTLTYGRCQTPLLNKIVEREKEIRNFSPENYWILKTEFKIEDKILLGTLVEPIDKHFEAVHFEDKEKGQKSIDRLPEEASLHQCKIKNISQEAPGLYSLNKLQQRINIKYGYTALETLEILQSLYAARKIISYPRSDCTVLSEDMRNIILDHLWQLDFGLFHDSISKIRKMEDIATPDYIFDDTKITDHTAIIPVLNKKLPQIYENLTIKEKHVFHELVRSLIAVFYPNYQYRSILLIISCGDYLFNTVKKSYYNVVGKNCTNQKAKMKKLRRHLIRILMKILS